MKEDILLDFSIFCCILFFYLLAPAASPNDLKAYNTSESTSLVLTWEEVPILERNGIIRGYNLRWMKLCDFLSSKNRTSNLTDCNRVISRNISDFQMKFVPSKFLQDIVTNLSPFTHYILRISATTSAGFGPEREIIAMTDEDGSYESIVFIDFCHKEI